MRNEVKRRPRRSWKPDSFTKESLYAISMCMSTPIASENKMGVKPIPSLVLSMSFPIMLSMLVQALYNVVDSLYVSHYSQDALTALTLAFPLQNLLIAVSVGTSIGINSLISRKLGAQDKKAASKAAGNGITISLLSWLQIGRAHV